jgi:hypothetical protein
VTALFAAPDDDMGSHADCDRAAGPPQSGDAGKAPYSCQYPVSNIAQNLL